MQQKPCKRPNQVRNPATGRCIDGARLRRQVAKKPAAKKPVAKNPAGCKRPNQVRNPATGRCIDAARLRRQAAKKPVAKKPSPVKKTPSPPRSTGGRIYGKTWKETCRATAVNKCKSPCSVIRLPNGKQMCTKVKKPAKGPTKRTMHALARMA